MRILTPLKNTLRNILPQTNCILSFVLSYTLISTYPIMICSFILLIPIFLLSM